MIKRKSEKKTKLSKESLYDLGSFFDSKSCGITDRIPPPLIKIFDSSSENEKNPSKEYFFV